MPQYTRTSATSNTTVLMDATNTNTNNNSDRSKKLYKVNSYPDIVEVLKQSLNNPSTTLETATLSPIGQKEIQR